MVAGAAAAGWWIAGSRVNRTVGDPSLQDSDFLGREFPLGGHLQRVIPITDGPDQQALVGTSRPDGCSAVAAGLPTLAGVESEPSLGGGGPGRVAGIATADQQWTDVLFEFGNPGRTGCRWSGLCGGRKQDQQWQYKSEHAVILRRSRGRV